MSQLVHAEIVEQLSWLAPRPHGAIACLQEVGGIGHRVLELSCGSGVNAHYLAKAGHDVTGIDSNAHAVRAARAKGEQWWSSARFHLLAGDKVPMHGTKYDTVLDYGRIAALTLAQRRRFARSLRGVTRLGGAIYVFLNRQQHAQADAPAALELIDPLEEEGWRLERVDAVLDDRNAPARDGWLLRLRAV